MVHRAAHHPGWSALSARVADSTEARGRVADESTREPWVQRWEVRRRLLAVGPAVAVLVLAAAVYSRFSINTTLSRDESAYVYAGQQQVEGVPFYVSIFEQKTPLAAEIAAVGVAVGRALGIEDVHGVRLAFFVFACLTVLAVYLLGVALFGSKLMGLLGAATFASFRGFALDALTGPNAKMPGIFFAVLAMALLVRRRYFWGAFTASLAFLVWQPLAVYAVVAIGAAALTAERRAVAAAVSGAAIPLAVTTVAFWLAGALDDLVGGVVRFPLEYLERPERTLGQRLTRIIDKVDQHYGDTRVLFWGGLACLFLLVVLRAKDRRFELVRIVRTDAYVNIVLVSFIPIAVFSTIDFQGYPDVYPLLPYAAIGVAGGFSYALRGLDRLGLRRPGVAVAAAGIVVLAISSWISYSERGGRPQGLIEQRADARQLEALLQADDTVHVLGNPVPLVLMQRRNPTPYSYLAGGMDRWAIDHTPGGFDGWTRQIQADDPAAIIQSGWRSPYAVAMCEWLEAHYMRVRLGGLPVYVTPEVLERSGERPRPSRCSRQRGRRR